MLKRNIRSVIVLALSLCFTVSLIACNDGNHGENPSEEHEVRRVVLADYESYDDIFNTSPNVGITTFEGHYTLASLSDREAKVASIAGNDSLELCIEGTVGEHYAGYDYDSGTPARIYYDVRNNTKNQGDWGFDWKYVCGASVDVYNDNDFDIRVSMLHMRNGWFPCNYGSITVPAKQKKTLHVNVNRYFMQKENQREIAFVSIAVDYDRQVLADGSLYYPKAYVYLDNLSVDVDETPVYDAMGNAIVTKNFSSEQEILNFDDENDLRYMRELGQQYVKESDNIWLTEAWFEGTGSSYHYNTDEKYVHEGNRGSLEWRINPTYQAKYNSSAYRFLTDKNYMEPNALTGITVCGDYLNFVNLAYLQEGNAQIKVDVYNAAPFDKEVAFGIHDNSGLATVIQYDFPYDYGAMYSTDKWFRLPAGKWTTLTLDDFSYIDISNGLARLWLLTSVLDVNEEISFYVNNLRVEYGNSSAQEKTGLQQNRKSDDWAPVAEENGLYKVYALDDARNLAAHMGGRMNGIGVSLVNFEDKTDRNGKSLAVTEEMRNAGITDGIFMQNYRALGRVVLQNPLYLDWDKKFEQLYFYFYNAGYGAVTINFNNYTIQIPAGTGWQKVVIAPKTVTDGQTQITVTDYTKISSLGKTTTMSGMIDLEDCVGSFLMFTTESDKYYEQFAMSAIYGVPYDAE